MAITFRHLIPLIGPYVQSIKDLKKEYGDEIQDEKTMWSFSNFKYNESVGLKNNPDYNIRYIDEEFPEVMEDFNFLPSMEKVKEMVKKADIKPVNIIDAVPPCAGLSLMGKTQNSLLNRFMLFVVKFYLASNSDILCFENAPALSTKSGQETIDQIKAIIKENGYDRQITLTQVSTLNHGIPQNRKRTFAYIYKGDSIKLSFNKKSAPKISEFLNSLEHIKDDPMDVIADSKWDLYSHQFVSKVEEAVGGFNYDKNKTTYRVMVENKITPEQAKSWNIPSYNIEYYIKHVYDHYVQGKGWWDHSPLIVKDYLGALTSKNNYRYYVADLHRLITLREIIQLMGYPKDFMLDSTEKNCNVICQNIPIPTATDSLRWAIQILNKTMPNPSMNGKVSLQSEHGNFDRVEEYLKNKVKVEPQKKEVSAFMKAIRK